MKTFERILKALRVTPLGFFYTMDRIARVAQDLQKTGKRPARQLIGEPGQEGEEVFQRVVRELMRVIQAGRRKRGRGQPDPIAGVYDSLVGWSTTGLSLLS